MLILINCTLNSELSKVKEMINQSITLKLYCCKNKTRSVTPGIFFKNLCQTCGCQRLGQGKAWGEHAVAKAGLLGVSVVMEQFCIFTVVVVTRA